MPLSTRSMRGEVSAKTTYQRTANGPVSIAEANPEGKFIMLENNSTGGIRKVSLSASLMYRSYSSVGPSDSMYMEYQSGGSGELMV